MTHAYRERIKVKEGTVRKNGRHVLYKDSVGKWTIGWGRNLTDRGLSDTEASVLLTNDIAEHWHETELAFPWFPRLDPVRQEVVAEMAFNMGVPTLKTFVNTLKAVREARWEDAARGMLASKWAGQVGARANELAQMMRTGVRI